MGRMRDDFMTVMRRTALVLLALFLLAPAWAMAQPTHIAPKLIAESAAPAPGETTTIALAMTPEKSWHGYWTNGGDAGFGLQVEWNAPEGVTVAPFRYPVPEARSEEHTSELQSLMRISYAVFCLKKKITTIHQLSHTK